MGSSLRRVDSSLRPLCDPPLQPHRVGEPCDGSPPGEGIPLESPFLGVRAVAAYLGVSYNSVLGAIKNGLLAAHRFGPRGGTYRIHQTDLERYLQTCQLGRPPRRRSDKRQAGSTFKKLDTERLLNAWKSQGVVPNPSEE
jgi:excisionase family DNA binding protein